MKIRKLNWAGIEVTCGEYTVLIDAVENFAPYFPVLVSVFHWKVTA